MAVGRVYGLEYGVVTETDDSWITDLVKDIDKPFIAFDLIFGSLVGGIARIIFKCLAIWKIVDIVLWLIRRKQTPTE